MPTNVHPARPPETAQAAAQQRATFHLLAVQQVLHLRLRSAHPLEDNLVRAKSWRGRVDRGEDVDHAAAREGRRELPLPSGRHLQAGTDAT